MIKKEKQLYLFIIILLSGCVGYLALLNKSSITNIYWGLAKKTYQSLEFLPRDIKIFNQQVQQAHVLLDQSTIPSAKELYLKMNSEGQIFNIGTGIGLTQTVYNTAPSVTRPTTMRKLLYNKASQIKNPYKWLKERQWYVLTSLPEIHCHDCKGYVNLHKIKEVSGEVRENILQNVAETLINPKYNEIIVTQCPYCHSPHIKMKPQVYKEFTTQQQSNMLQQVVDLGSLTQSKLLPSCRISLQLSDVLQENSDQIDSLKLKKVAQFIAQFKNPLIFFHHYSNPAVKPHLFEKQEDITWFADICRQIIQECPHVTHVCPISQPFGFGFKVANQEMLPPFGCHIDTAQYLKYIMLAQKEATIAIKSVRPDIKVLLSHQWKPMKPSHTKFYDPRYGFEKIASSIADIMYNQSFIDLFKDQAEYVDGIALSIYPALYFNYFKPIDGNCSGIVDQHAALDSILEMHKTFPEKDIYIVEAGCNCSDPTTQKRFLDTALYVCYLARQMNIPIKTCFFWTHTNDIDFYREWNYPPASTYFGFYDTIQPGSLNGFGAYLKEIITKR